MSYHAKAKAKGISATSFFDLKAELSKKESEFTRNKAAGPSNARPDKKPTVWTRANKGVNARAARDIELEAISKPTLESARAALERKAKIYDKLRKGKTGGLNDQQYDSLLVDFDSKRVSDFESDSEDEDESKHLSRSLNNTNDDPMVEYTDEYGRTRMVPQSEVPEQDEDDPMIEYEDEFGRMRTARKSDVPRHLLPKAGEDEIDSDEDIIIRNPVGHFPVYEPTMERAAEIEKTLEEENKPLGVHYDAGQEIRNKGAGFYQFSGDEETRRAQMAELKAAREETDKARQETGAIDLKPGDVEGMQNASVKSRAAEKRKRDLEERRKVLDAKRRKLKGKDVAATDQASTTSAGNGDAPASELFTAAAPSDPFGALEAQQTSQDPSSQSSGKASQEEVDAFLAGVGIAHVRR